MDGSLISFISVIGMVVTSLATVIANIFISHKQHKTSIHIKKIESTYNAKIQIFRDFGKYFGNLNDDYKPEDCALFYSAAYQVMLVCSDKTRTEIQKFICYMKEGIHQSFSDAHRKEFRVHLNARFEECSELIYLDLHSYEFNDNK